MDRKRRAFERKYGSTVKSALMKQAEPVIAQIERDYEQVNSRIDYIEDKPIEDAYVALYAGTGVWFAVDYLSSLGGAEVPAANLESVFDRQFRRYAREECGEFIKEVSNYSKKKMRAVMDEILKPALERAVDEGLSTDKIARIIKENFKTRYGEISTARAKTIARTEVMRASNMANHEAALASGLTHVRTWVNGGSNVRDSHLEAASNSANINIPMDKPFVVSGIECMYPGDATLPIEETANCKCIEQLKVLK